MIATEMAHVNPEDEAEEAIATAIATTTAMTGGGTYQVSAEGVTDLSGNESAAEASFTAVSQAPTVDVVLTYTISDSIGVVGVGAGGHARRAGCVAPHHGGVAGCGGA